MDRIKAFIAINGDHYLPDTAFIDGGPQYDAPLVPMDSEYMPELFPDGEKALRHAEWWSRGDDRPRQGWKAVPIEVCRVRWDADVIEGEPVETPEQPPEAEPEAPVDVPAVELHVIDADTRKRVQKVEGGETVTGTSNWNLSASGDGLAGVEFDHNGKKRMERVFPYMLFGDRDGVPHGEKAKPGPVEVSTRLVLTDGRTVDGPSVRFTFG